MAARIAILSDIHANLPALEAVLEDLTEQGCGEICCLGDLVGYGARPSECIELLRSRGIPCLRGNHDAAVMEGSAETCGGGSLAQMWEWTEQALGSDQRQWLASLPLVLRRAEFEAVHATLHAPEKWGYVIDAQSAELHFREQEGALCFIGHTHRPMVWRSGDECGRLPSDPVKIDHTTKQLINVGSVGQPRDGDARACYATYDLEKSEVVWRRVAYNITLAQNAIEDAGLPIQFADRLSEGK
jgi:diadenosine tetraphosphatase ApaH/serine/threonine PP2A family protein phosphatase